MFPFQSIHSAVMFPTIIKPSRDSRQQNLIVCRPEHRSLRTKTATGNAPFSRSLSDAGSTTDDCSRWVTSKLSVGLFVYMLGVRSKYLPRRVLPSLAACRQRPTISSQQDAQVVCIGEKHRLCEVGASFCGGESSPSGGVLFTDRTCQEMFGN